MDKQIGRNSQIAIVGGSLTGPALALLLRRAGFCAIKVYEAMSSAVPLAGGVIGLDHVSLDILDGVGIEQDEIVAFPSERVVSFKVLERHNARRSVQLFPGRNSTWNLLHDALMRRLPAEVFQSSRRVIGLERDGRASLHFAKGEPVEADLIAFADGRRSVGRSLLDPRRTLRYAGYVAHRGQVPYEPSDIRDFVRFESEHSQFNVFPVPLMDGTIGVDWTFYLPTTVDEFRDLFGGDPATRTFITKVSEQARRAVDEAAERVLSEAQAALVRRTAARTALPIVDIAPPRSAMRTVGQSTAVMVGDALAPVRPHTARGANNGLAGAAGLAVALGQSRRYDADLATALRGWQARYLPLVLDSVNRGPEIGRELGLS